MLRRSSSIPSLVPFTECNTPRLRCLYINLIASRRRFASPQVVNVTNLSRQIWLASPAKISGSIRGQSVVYLTRDLNLGSISVPRAESQLRSVNREVNKPRHYIRGRSDLPSRAPLAKQTEINWRCRIRESLDQASSMMLTLLLYFQNECRYKTEIYDVAH